MAFFQPQFTSDSDFSYYPNLRSVPSINGMDIQHVSTTQFNVRSGAARAFASDYVIALPRTGAVRSDFVVSVDTASVGALGCYPELPADAAPTNDTSFGVYVLGDTSGKNPTTVIVATGDDFLLPGYSVWRRIGQVHFSAGTNNMKFNVVAGHASDRQYQYIDTLELVSGASEQTYSEINLSAGNFPCNPEYVTGVELQIKYTPITAASVLEIVTSTAPVTSNPPIIVKSTTDAVEMITDIVFVPDINSSSTSFFWRTTDASDLVDLRLISFTESLATHLP